MKQTLKERIEELERQVRELQARPPMAVYPPPVFVPYVLLTYPAIQPVWPHVWPYQSPYSGTPIVTCDASRFTAAAPQPFDNSTRVNSDGSSWSYTAQQ